MASALETTTARFVRRGGHTIVACNRCGGEMTAVMGAQVAATSADGEESAGALGWVLFWRCDRNRHTTAAMPIPEKLLPS